MNDSINKALEHAKIKCPEESCGFIGIRKGKSIYYECDNVSLEKEKYFTISPIDYIKAEEFMEITHIVHSHPNTNPNPSQADLVSIESTGVPWLIVNPRTNKHTITNPSGYKAPMIGREFTFGVLDCYSIIKDHYKLELGIDIPNFERTDKFWERGENIYLDNFEKANFKKASFEDVNDIKVNDVILMTVSSSIVNHAAVYLGDGKMIHHVQGRFSSIDMYGGYWLKNTWGIVRHKELL